MERLKIKKKFLDFYIAQTFIIVFTAALFPVRLTQSTNLSVTSLWSITDGVSIHTV